MADNNPGTRAQLLTDSLTIAIASAVSYLVSFLFERGYADHFGVPATFITPSLSTILVSAAAIGTILVWVVVASPIYSHLWIAAENTALSPYRYLLRQASLVVMVEVVMIALYGWSWPLVLVILAVGLGPEILSTCVSAIADRKLPFRDRLAKHAELQDRDPGFELVRRWTRLLGPNGGSVVLVFFLLVVVAYGAGHSHASRQDEFLVSATDNSQVLLRAYGDLLIFAKVDRAKKLVTGELTLAWLSDKKSIELKVERLGTLRRDVPVDPTKRNAASGARAASASASEVSR